MATNYFITDFEKSMRAQHVDVEMLKSLSHATRRAILTHLARKEAYPKEIAAALHIPEQQVYYHLQQLTHSGIVLEKSRKEVRGTIAKCYGITSAAFFFTLRENWDKLGPEQPRTAHIPFFSRIFSEEEITIVVGSSDPHGPFKSRARDSYLAAELAHFLGAQNPETKIRVRLDTDIEPHTHETSCITIGGPITNTYTSFINGQNAAKFSTTNFHQIDAKNSYTEEGIGLIAKTPHPEDSTKEIITLGGISARGTRAAILGITRQHKLIFHRYTGQKKFHAIVQGYDTDGDGIIDEVELLE